jgi:hypothetical protein
MSQSNQPVPPRPAVRWSRRPGEFACRFQADDLKGLLVKGLGVAEGSRGLLFQSGKLVGVLPPGYHTVENAISKLKAMFVGSACEVLLVDVGEFVEQLEIGGLRTRDDHDVQVKLEVTAAMGDKPLPFLENIMRSRSELTNAEVVETVRTSATRRLEHIISGCDSSELRNPELLERVRDELTEELEPAFARNGLALRAISVGPFRGAEFADVRLRQEQLRHYEQWQRLEHKFHELATEDRMYGVKSKADFLDFVKQVEHDAGLGNLLRKQQNEELWRQYHEKREDHQLARAHLLETLRWQRKTAALEFEMEYKSQLVRNQHELDDVQRRHKITKLEEEHRAKIEHEDREHQAALARADKDFKLGLDHKQAQSQVQLDEQQRRLDMALDANRRHKEIKDEQTRRHHDMDLEKLRAYSEASAEALIAMAPQDRAAMLADLKKTDALKGFSENQILAMAADKSPEVARAFQEQFKAQGNREMYERLIKAKEESLRAQVSAGELSSQRMQEIQREHIRTMQEFQSQALQTMRDTAVAAVRGPQPPGPTVVYPQAGSVAVHSGATTCPHCHASLPAGARFCGCGYQIG